MRAIAARTIPYLHALFDDVNRREDNACNSLSVASNKHVSQYAIACWHPPLASLVAGKV